MGLQRGNGGIVMRKLAVAVAAAAVLTAGVGCSTLGRAAFEQPVVHLRDVKVRGLGLTGGSLDVLLSVYNPNHYRLDATRLTYKVALAGDSVTLATGALDSRTSPPIPVAPVENSSSGPLVTKVRPALSASSQRR